MKKAYVISVFLILFVSNIFSQQNIVISEADKNYLIENYHQNKKISLYWQFFADYGDSNVLTNYWLIEPLFNDLDKLYTSKIEKYYLSLEIIKRSNIKNISGRGFLNPIKLMIDTDDFINFDKTIKIVPILLSTPTTSSETQTGYSPLAYSISENKKVWFDLIIGIGVDINGDHNLYPSNYESNYKINLLSIANDSYIKTKLISLGVNQIAKVTWDSYCTDDNVRLRRLPSIDSEVLGKINMNVKFVVIVHTYETYYLLDGTPGKWVNIRYNNQEYWIWSSYVWSDKR